MNGLRSRQGQASGLRPGLSESQKEGALASNRNRGPGAPIVVVDDDDEVEVSSARDDEVEVSSARSFAQARNSGSQRGSRAPVINDEDLELRLGLTGIGTTVGTIRTLADHNPRRKHNRVPPNKTIVLCDDGGEFDHNDSKVVCRFAVRWGAVFCCCSAVAGFSACCSGGERVLRRGSMDSKWAVMTHPMKCRNSSLHVQFVCLQWRRKHQLCVATFFVKNALQVLSKFTENAQHAEENLQLIIFTVSTSLAALVDYSSL